MIEAVPGTRLNPDEAGEPLPTTIRLFQLNSMAKMQGADFEDVIGDAAELLEDTLVVSQDITLFPNQPTRVSMELAPEARFLVGVAIVRRPSGTMWRSVVVLPAVEERCDDYLEDGAPEPAIVFRVQDYRISGTSHIGDAADSELLPEAVTD